MNYNDIHWVWFDLDDTLIDFHTNSRAALARLYREYQLNRWFATVEIWREAYETHNLRLWELYAAGGISRADLRLDRFLRPLSDAGIEPAEAMEMSRRFDTIYLDFLAEEKELVDGAVEALLRMRQSGFSIGVLSNGFAEVQHRKIARAGLDRLIDITVLSDDCGHTKPDPEIYRYAMERVGDTNPSHHLMIGDNPSTDIRGALSAGWRAIWLTAKEECRPCPEGAERITALAEL